jgi:branched-chain amino acid transport system substrate-binding protein
VLGEKYDSVVTGATYEIQDPTIDSQIVKLKASGADVFVIAATPKFAAQSIRKGFEMAGDDDVSVQRRGLGVDRDGARGA